MQISKRFRKGETGRFNIRLDDETAAFYRARANEHGITVSEYLRQLLVQGVIAENVNEIDYRLKATVADLIKKLDGGAEGGLPPNAHLSIYTSEELLKAIVEARDPQALYAAQDRAKKRLEKERG